jgi:hypothetical protein
MMRYASWLPVVLGLLLWGPVAMAQESYWGPIPAGDSTSTVTYKASGNHSVEHALLAPFYLVTYPIFLTTRVLKAGIVFADEHGITPGLGPTPPIHLGNISMGPAITAGGHGGFGGGGTILYQGGSTKQNLLALRYVTTMKGFHRGSAGFRAPWGRRSILEIGGGYRLERNARFFGIGPTSDESNLSFFTQEQSWGGAAVRRSLGRRVSSEWKAVYTTITTRAPRNEETPGVAQQFAGDLPLGYNDLSRGVLYSGLLRYDTTDEDGRPSRGVIAQAQTTYFGPTSDNQSSFWRYTGEAGTFLPLFFTDRTLALRGAVSWTGPTDTDEVVFMRLATNHSGETLRGYRDYRWRDRGLVDLAAEYRWPVWALERPHGVGVDAYAFLNSGQVFGDWDGIKARLWRTSYGGGFRMILSSGFGGRLELARSNESTLIRIQADQMFDFKDLGLFGGNYHVAAPN